MWHPKITFERLLFFNIAYLVIFSFIAFVNNNFEFLFYLFMISIVLSIILIYYKRIYFPLSIMAGLSVIGALHVAGGNIFIGDTLLYDLWFIRGIFKYDNMIHFLASLFTTMLIYSLLSPHMDKKIHHNGYVLSIILILIASGLGAFNEIIEFIAVVFLDAAQRVGGYTNNALDLVFNFFGAIVGAIITVCYHKVRVEKACPTKKGSKRKRKGKKQ